MCNAEPIIARAPVCVNGSSSVIAHILKRSPRFGCTMGQTCICSDCRVEETRYKRTKTSEIWALFAFRSPSGMSVRIMPSWVRLNQGQNRPLPHLSGAGIKQATPRRYAHYEGEPSVARPGARPCRIDGHPWAVTVPYSGAIASTAGRKSCSYRTSCSSGGEIRSTKYAFSPSSASARSTGKPWTSKA